MLGTSSSEKRTAATDGETGAAGLLQIRGRAPLATLFIAQALGVDLSFSQQLTILVVAMLTSKGASRVTGAGFITLAAMLSVVNPALGMAIVFSVDKFMSEVRHRVRIVVGG